MTKQEFLKLTGDELVVFKPIGVEDNGKAYQIKEIKYVMSKEPKYTIRQFLEMDTKNIEKLKKWKPEVLYGYIILDTDMNDREIIRRRFPSFGLRNQGIDYKNLKVVK